MSNFNNLINSLLKENEYGPRPVYKEPGHQSPRYGILLHKEDRYGKKGPFYSGDNVDGGPFEGDIKLLSIDLLDTKEDEAEVYEVTYTTLDRDGDEHEGVSDRITQHPARVLGMATVENEFGEDPGYYIVGGNVK